MAIVEDSSELLLQGFEGVLSNLTLQYLDTGATNHTSGCKNFFRNLDEAASGFVKFGDNSRAQIEGRGDILINHKARGVLYFSNVLFVPRLVAKILNLSRLDEEGYQMTMFNGKLTIFDHKDHLFGEVQRYERRVFLLKLNVVDQCLLTTDDNIENWLQHSRFGHINFHSLKEMYNQHLMDGLSQIYIPTRLCQDYVVRK